MVCYYLRFRGARTAPVSVYSNCEQGPVRMKRKVLMAESVR